MRIPQALFIVCGLLLALPACRGGKESAPPTSGPPVQAIVAEAQLTGEPLFREALGTVRAEAAGVIAGRSMGTVTRVKVREGDRVREGDLLLSIDDPRAREQIKQAEEAERETREAAQAATAALEAAQARSDLAAATFQRFRSLIAQGAVSRQEFDRAEAAHREAMASRTQAEKAAAAAAARLAQAEAAVRILRADTEVRAPYDGIVTARPIEAGSLAAPGTPLLTLERAGALRVDVSVPEGLAGTVVAGDSLRIFVPDAATGPFTATVLTVVPASDPQSRTFTVQARLPESPDLQSGMFARALIPAGMTEKILLPLTAIVRQGQLTGVYTVDNSNRARFRLVRPGAAGGDRVEVLAGLHAGERFVVQPADGLVDGVTVETSP